MKSKYIKKVGNYYLTEILGNGTYGIVYKAMDISNNVYAIKMVRKKDLTQNGYQNLERESELIQKITHPNIMKLVELLKTENNYYFMFEYCDIGDMESYRRKYSMGIIPILQTRSLIQQIVNGLSAIPAAWSRGEWG